MASGIAGVAIPSPGLTLEGVIQGIGKATDQNGTNAVGDAIQLFQNLGVSSETQAAPGSVSDLGSYPDPVRFLNTAFGKSKVPLSEFVSSKDVFLRLVDPDFNFRSALDDAMDGFLGEKGLVTALKNPKWAENLKIDQTQFQQLQNMQSFVKQVLDLHRGVSRDLRA
jgi:hypothetical protein